ncbi:MAG TPA: hypothetical protein ENI12_03280 [Nitrospirae bacterium]|nr:hypothetical protein [Nitrospirota bacterium]
MKARYVLSLFIASPVIFTLIVLGTACAGVDKMVLLKGKQAVVYHPQGFGQDAANVIGVLDESVLEIKQELGYGLDYIPAIVLMTDKSAFEQAIMSRHISAYAISEKGIIVMDYTRVLVKPFTLKGTIKHELVHLVLGNNLKTQIPKWLNEGVAQLVAGGPAEIVLSRNTSMLSGAVLSGRMIPLESIKNSFPRPRRGMVLAYEESLSFIRFIESEFGKGTIRSILGEIESGATAPSAIKSITGEPLAELERRWMEDLYLKATWLSYISNHFYELLFILAALLTMYGFLRVTIRIRTYRDEDEDEAFVAEALRAEEKAHPPDPKQ